jgi:hypothetical protein
MHYEDDYDEDPSSKRQKPYSELNDEEKRERRSAPAALFLAGTHNQQLGLSMPSAVKLGC